MIPRFLGILPILRKGPDASGNPRMSFPCRSLVELNDISDKIGWLAGRGVLIILACIVLTILGIGGKAKLEFQGFTLAAGAGVVFIIIGINVLAFGIEL